MLTVSVPPELLLCILDRLPITDILTFSCVSKSCLTAARFSSKWTNALGTLNNFNTFNKLDSAPEPFNLVKYSNRGNYSEIERARENEISHFHADPRRQEELWFACTDFEKFMKLLRFHCKCWANFDLVLDPYSVENGYFVYDSSSPDQSDSFGLSKAFNDLREQDPTRLTLFLNLIDLVLAIDDLSQPDGPYFFLEAFSKSGTISVGTSYNSCMYGSLLNSYKTGELASLKMIETLTARDRDLDELYGIEIANKILPYRSL